MASAVVGQTENAAGPQWLSQTPPDQKWWHSEIFGDPTLGDAILDRLVHKLTAFNSPEKACEKRPPAIKLLTPPQTPEPITMSVEAAAHDRAKYMLTIKRNERSPSREIAAHNQRNAHPRY